MRPTPAIDKYIAPLFRTTDEKPLLFTLELELLGAPLPIKRTQKIPSNMNLGDAWKHRVTLTDIAPLQRRRR